jgi:hypothetical protein
MNPDTVPVGARGVPRTLAIVFAWWVALSGTAAAAEDLGRLFFTPQQRQELDRRRQANIQETAAVTVESTVTVNGHVSRSSGKTTTWINGVPQYDRHRTRDPARITVGGNEGEPSVEVKVGQTLDKTTGAVKDPLDAGRVVVPSGKRRERTP